MLVNESQGKVRKWVPVTGDGAIIFGSETSVASSAAQREIFGPSLLDADASRAYNHSISIHFEGALDLDAIYSALLNLLNRHEALRGHFTEDGAHFVVRERIAFSLPLVDLSARGASEQKAEYDAYVQRELDHVFDLVNGPLFRSALFRFSESKWSLVFNCHHAVVDGWSLKTILDDLPKLYSALVTGRDRANLAASSSFVEYLESTVAMEKDKSAVIRQFWKKTFEDGVPSLDLPLDRSRPRYRTYRSHREDYKIDRKVYDRLKEVGAKNGTSTFVTLLSAFSLYLSRISGQDDIVVGVPAAGQIKSGKAKLLGHDARLMPLRCQIQPGDTFKTYSARVMDRFFPAYENQWISMPELLQELQVRPDPARVALTSVMFNFDPGMKAEDFRFEGLKAHHFFNHRNFETVEISINAVVEDSDMVLECAYNSDLFDVNEMHQRLMQVERLMKSISENPEVPVKQLLLLTEKQIQDMDSALNATAMDYEPSLCVDQMIARHVQSSPKSIAVEYGDNQLSYEALWAESGKVAETLRRLDLGRNPMVGVLVERSERMVPLLLGIWRAGGAFVPLDPNYPKDRLEYIVEQSGIRVVLAQESLTSLLETKGVTYLDVAGIWETEGLKFEGNVPGKSSNDLAYVIYTSGSTGKPKGVKVPQRALNNFLRTMTKCPGLTAQDRVLAVTTLSFDIAELELWLPLVNGARTVVVDRATAIDGMALIDLVQKKKISMIQATPATWRLLIFSGWEGDPKITGLCGGEALPRELADDILKRVGVLWNVYGPTETTVWSTLDRVGDGPITIGRPIGNTQTYVLDDCGNWVPRGVVGELWIGGDGVTDGYFGRDDLTRERFVPNRFTGKGSIYKTGDLVRLRPDGRIEYVGRNDFQVKVRGYRIELGEVQVALSRQPSIQQCVVVAQEKSPGDAHLVAYYCLKSGKKAKVAELKEFMKGSIPDYMLPSYFVELAQMPLTPNGKINVKALPSAFAQDAAAADDFVAPQTEHEIYLAKVWSDLLGLSRVGKTDRFLELGGNSILVVRAISRIEKDRGVRLPPKSMVFKSLELLAAEIAGEPIEPIIEKAVAVQKTGTETPLFFGAANSQKFGYFYAPQTAATQGVVVCPPLGQEYMRTHWLIRNLSVALNRKGAPVLRFDFAGQGDSFGKPEELTLEALCTSVVEAVREMQSRAGLKKVSLIAFRASALVAQRAVERLGSDVTLILIDPPRSGRDYFEELRRVQMERWSAYPYTKSWVSNARFEEILGSLYSKSFVAELESLELKPGFPVVKSRGAGWSSFKRIEEIWISPDLIRELQNTVFGETV